MDSNSSNKANFHFVCTNYGSNKDGIGHYTQKIVDELKNNSFNVKVYSSITYDLSKKQLVFSLRMSKELLRLKKNLHKNSNENFIIIEYPFVEYNPLFLVILFFIKIQKSSKTKIVISLHEYSRTKLLRKTFIKSLVPLSDVILCTKDEDIKPFVNKKIIFKKRIIPANIEPKSRKKRETPTQLNVCFFGIINFETKEIKNMLKGWELFLNNSSKKNITFHFITSTYNKNIDENKSLKYHYNLEDNLVSNLLHKMQFMLLPLKPKISLNNGSLSVSCVHECVPVGVFDDEYFDENFGVRMKCYSEEEFENIFKLINNMDINLMKKKSKKAFEYGKQKSVANCAKTYSELIEL